MNRLIEWWKYLNCFNTKEGLNTDLLEYEKKACFAIAILRIVTIVISLSIIISVVSFSWFSHIFEGSDNQFVTGKLSPEIEMYFYDITNKTWEKIHNTGSTSTWVFPTLGEMTDLTTLPKNCEGYIKLRVVEPAEVVYTYDVFLESIDIDVEGNYDDSNIIVTELFDCEITVKDANNLNPTTTNFFSQPNPPDQPFPNRLDQFNMSLTNESSLTDNEWVYIKVIPRLEELQNIILSVPISDRPYSINYRLNIIGEVTTVDEIS